MTNKEILTKAIQKAIEGGWRPHGVDTDYFKVTPLAAPLVIFNHDFAKALWGEDEFTVFKLVELSDGGKSSAVKQARWQYHLQMMVVIDDPIVYLGANI